MKLIIGLSGGRDSVALVHFLYTQRVYKPVLAHMNFHLRGEESDRDEAFVRRLAEDRFPEAELAVKGVDTFAYASEHKISLEMAARELRYAWFEELRKTHGADYTAVAHHADDQIETVLLNLARGTGGAGLTGMREKDETRHLIRPFLSKTRAEIEAYMAENHLPYVEDSTNADEAIRRNYIRHTLIPAFEKLNPSFRWSFLRSIGYFSEEQSLLDSLIEERARGRYDEETRSIRLDETDAAESPVVLRRLFAPFGFNDDQVRSLSEAGDRSGLRFELPGNGSRAETFRGRLYLYHRSELPAPFRLEVHPPDDKLLIEKLGTFRISSDPVPKSEGRELRMALDHFSGPVIVRNAEPSDRFTPFGMKHGSKLLFDYLKECGIPQMYRPFCPVLVSEENGVEVLAVLPFEISEKVRIVPNSKKVLYLSFTPYGTPLSRLLGRL